MDVDDYVPLELVPDDFTEEEHKAMDSRLDWISTQLNKETLALFGPRALEYVLDQLGGIVEEGSPTEYLGKLIGSHPCLGDMLLEASQKRSYSSVRRLKILRKEPKEYTPVDPTNTLAAKLAWTCEYLGNHHKDMLNSINAMDRSFPLSNSVSLTQSSGTGKSRMVHEMARLVFTIPLNVRGYSWSAYPPTDNDVCYYLCGFGVRGFGVKEAKDGEARAALFFQKLFSEVTTELEHVFSGGQITSPCEFALEWWNHLSVFSRRYRQELYSRVVQACEKAPPQSPSQGSDEMWLSLDRLLAALYKYCRYTEAQENDIKIVLYFDEAHELWENSTMYESIRSALSWSGPAQSPIFTIFVSTHLPPSKEFLHAPITETPFDCHPSFPLRTGGWKVSQLGELHFLARFGRPLFWTMLAWDKEGKGSRELLNHMMQLARAKLLLSNDIDSFDYSTIAKFVLVDVLVMLDVQPTHREWQVDMVTGHMRTMFSVPKHGRYVSSGYPSEPLLAEAAARQVCHYPRVYGPRDFDMSSILATGLSSGTLDSSQKAEMVMRVLLRMAYMDAVVAEQGGYDSHYCTVNFSRGCSFLKFLRALFSRKFRPTVLNYTPDNVASNCTLASAFKRATVRFTHFARAADPSAMTMDSMVPAFLRGVAIVRPPNVRTSMDIVIPILLDKDDEIRPESMSGMLIRVQLQDDSGGIDETGFFQVSAAGQDTRPYVTLVATLGLDSPQKLKRGTAPSSAPNHPRYSMHVYGCNSESAWQSDYSASIDFTNIMATDYSAVSADPVHEMLPRELSSAGIWYEDGVCSTTCSRSWVVREVEPKDEQSSSSEGEMVVSDEAANA